jgi:crotonobetainyl-CoA:carnitine CoA-transferase CaiB-like acyl-CoA transferase
MMQPLDGLRILDITRALAGPYCTMMLGDLGADVIKVERPLYGDECRGWGPPFVGEPQDPYPGESCYFIAVNRNKRSITVNLKSDGGQDIIRRLAASSDVLVENFRTGVLDKMGLGYKDLHALNPRLIYCSVSGYGRTGPYADRPGYDAILQAEGGMMGITGPIEGPPSRVGIPIIDITAGMFATTAILAALRHRDLTGEGQLVDVSLLDTHVALLTNVASNVLVGGMEHRRLGNDHPNIAPYGAFQARDKWFAVGAANQGQWSKLCEIIERPNIENDPHFATNSDRVTHRTELAEELNQAFAQRDAEEWLEKLRIAELPCGPINTIPEVFTHPQAKSRDLILETEHPRAGSVKLTGFPYKLSQTPAEVRLPPPLLGQHTEEILSETLNYSKQEIKTFQEQGAI